MGCSFLSQKIFLLSVSPLVSRQTSNLSPNLEAASCVVKKLKYLQPAKTCGRLSVLSLLLVLSCVCFQWPRISRALFWFSNTKEFQPGSRHLISPCSIKAKNCSSDTAWNGWVMQDLPKEMWLTLKKPFRKAGRCPVFERCELHVLASGFSPQMQCCDDRTEDLS